jgi:phosphoserine phosphatase
MSQVLVADFAPAMPADTPAPPAKVLFVDLDGTLVATDLLWESLLLAVKNRPLDVCKIPGWVMQGRAHLKRRLAERAPLDAGALPLREEVLEFLQEKRAAGWKLVLATASDRILADQIADELALFDDRLCTDGTNNLKGRAKLAAIEAYCRRHGMTEFAYIADARADLPIWEQAEEVYAVAPSRSLLRVLARLGKPTEVVGKRPPRLSPALKALRPHHWVKNLLLAVPLVLAHDLTSLNKVVGLLLAFVAFCACASSVYVLNDLLDLEADRHHPLKRHRPFASGALPLAWGPCLAAGLLVLAFGISLAALPAAFTGLLALYLVLNGLYSGWFKRKVMLDVLMLAGLYALRVLAGGLAADVLVPNQAKPPTVGRKIS